MKNNLLALLTIFILSALASLPLLAPGLHLIHDDQQIARLFLFDQALKAGQIPPRWVDMLGFGFGYPLFVFYPPFVYGLGEVFHLIGFGIIDSVKLVFFTSIFASGLSMYVFARYLVGKIPAIAAAAFYILLPYRALDIYIRRALAESFSFVWLPLILWSFLKLQNTKNTLYVFLSAIFLSLLLITHNLIFLPYTLILTVFILFLLLREKEKILFSKSLIKAAILTVALTAFFWAPALLEKKFTIVDDLLLVNLANYNIHFAYPAQLWNWPWGFGGSAEGLTDGISFKIGKLHVLTAAAAFLFTLVRLRSGKWSTISQLSAVFFLLFCFSALMTTQYSKSVWDTITPLQYLQFPWRFLTFTGLFASVLAGYFVYQLKLPILKFAALLSLVGLLVVFNLKLFRPQTLRPQLTDSYATSDEVVKWHISYSSFEYSPKGVALKVGDLGTNVINIQRSDLPKSSVEAIDKNVSIKNIEKKPDKITFDVEAEDESKIMVNTFNFPNWQAKVNGQKTAISDDNKFKLITITVPEGSSRVEVAFKNTPIRATSNLISLSALLFVLAYSIKTKMNQKI